MTPNELALIRTSGAEISRKPDDFSAAFYHILFDLAPATRPLFAGDMTEQRRKLADEVRFMIDAAIAWEDPAQRQSFLRRAHDLGRRHRGYDVTTAMYEPVGKALVTTMRELVDGFDDDHHRAWTKLFALISATMLEGASAIHEG